MAAVTRDDRGLDQELRLWLAQRGVDPIKSLTYEKVRRLIWGAGPRRPVHPADVERAACLFESRWSARELDGFRRAGALLLEYFEARVGRRRHGEILEPIGVVEEYVLRVDARRDPDEVGLANPTELGALVEPAPATRSSSHGSDPPSAPPATRARGADPFAPPQESQEVVELDWSAAPGHVRHQASQRAVGHAEPMQPYGSARASASASRGSAGLRRLALVAGFLAAAVLIAGYLGLELPGLGPAATSVADALAHE